MSDWLARVLSGEPGSETAVVERYTQCLLKLARRQLPEHVRRRVDRNNGTNQPRVAGGSFFRHASFERSASRLTMPPAYRNDTFGFRLARTYP